MIAITPTASPPFGPSPVVQLMTMPPSLASPPYCSMYGSSTVDWPSPPVESKTRCQSSGVRLSVGLRLSNIVVSPLLECVTRVQRPVGASGGGSYKEVAPSIARSHQLRRPAAAGGFNRCEARHRKSD